MNEELVTVYTVDTAMKADLIKNGLEAEGIPCFLDGLNQAVEVGIIPEVKILVPAAAARRAREWIMHHEKHSQHG